MATQKQTHQKYTITVLDQKENNLNSKIIARKNGGQLLTVKEFIQALKDPSLYLRMRGDTYWTADTGLNISGYSRIDYENGTIAGVSENEYKKLLVEQRAYAWNGNHNVTITVDSGHHVRLTIGADESDYPARVVLKKEAILVPEKIGASPHHAITVSGMTPELFKAMLEAAKSDLKGIEETVASDKTEHIRKLLRKLETKG